MTRLTKLGNGETALYTSSVKNVKKFWWKVRATQSNVGKICLGTVTLPPEFVGKKVMFIVKEINE